MAMERQSTRSAHAVRSAASRAGRLMPANGTVESLANNLARERGRPIRVLPHDLGPHDPSGFWIAPEANDWIVIPERVGSAQRTAIICHELAHILLGHTRQDTDAYANWVATHVAPDIDPVIVRRFLARSWYEDDVEFEAEELASQMVAMLARQSERNRLAQDSVSNRLR